MKYSRIGCAILVTMSAVMLISCSFSKAGSSAYRKESPSHAGRYAMTFSEIKTAALKGDADAQYALGFMYYYGKQVTRDMYLAKQWIHKAANQGQPRAMTALKLMGEQPSDSAPQFAYKKASSSASTMAMKKPVQFAKKESSTKPASNIAKANTQEATIKMVKAKIRGVTTITAKVSKPATKAPTTVAKKTTTKKPVVTAKKSTKSTKLSATLASSEKALLKKADDHFTLQLLGSRSVAQAQEVIAQNHLSGKASIYHTTFKGKNLYVLVYGDYKTPEDALEAIDRLPAMAQQLKPWVKPYASVKAGIRVGGRHHA